MDSLYYLRIYLNRLGKEKSVVVVSSIETNAVFVPTRAKFNSGKEIVPKVKDEGLQSAHQV